MTAAERLAVVHPGVDPADTATAVLAVAALGAVPILATGPADLGGCMACPPLSPVPPAPAIAVLCHREVDDDTSWIHRWPLGTCCLLREARPVVAKRGPAWIEVPSAVIES